MKRLMVLLIPAMTLTLWSNAFAGQDPQPSNRYQIIVKGKGTSPLRLKQAQITRRKIAGLSGIEVRRARAIGGGAIVFTFDKQRINKLSEQQHQSPTVVINTIAQRIAQDSDVEFAVRDRQVKMTAFDHQDQWDEFAPPGGVNLEGPDGAWEITQGDPNVVVAILDTGIAHHADLEKNIIPGYSFVSESYDNIDQGVETGYHGTHVAGTIAANGDILGMAPHVKIQPIQVLGEYGSGMMSDIISGMYWAAGLEVPNVPPNPTPAKVINMSLGGDGRCDLASRDAIKAINEQGVTIVVAAGNDDNDAYFASPANCADVITVSATNPEGHRSYYSNYGKYVDIAAPGGEIHPDMADGILSTIKDDYAYYQGTSMATPHVAGIVALLYSVDPSMEQKKAREIIQRTATPFPTTTGEYSCVGRYSCGQGIINASSAVREAAH